MLTMGYCLESPMEIGIMKRFYDVRAALFYINIIV